ARACTLALSGLSRYGTAAMTATPGYRVWAERADLQALEGTAHRVWADLALAHLARNAGRWQEGSRRIMQVLELARVVGEPAALAQAYWWAQTWLQSPQRHEM